MIVFLEPAKLVDIVHSTVYSGDVDAVGRGILKRRKNEHHYMGSQIRSMHSEL